MVQIRTKNGSKIAIVALGSFYSVGAKTAEIIENKTGVKPTIINPMYITGTDDNDVWNYCCERSADDKQMWIFTEKYCYRCIVA